MSILLASNVLPLLLRNSRFTLIPAKINNIKTEPQSRAAGYVMLCADGDAYQIIVFVGANIVRPCLFR